MKRNTEITAATYQPPSGDTIDGWHVNVPHWPPVIVTAEARVFRVGAAGTVTPRTVEGDQAFPVEAAAAVIDYLRQEPKDTVEDEQ